MLNNEFNQADGSARRQSPPPERLFGREALAWLEEGRITLGRFRAKLEGAPESLYEPLLNYFSFLTELAGAETRMALAELARRVRAGGTGLRAADWEPLLDALGSEHTTLPVTAETTLNELSEIFWREHTREN